MAAINIKNVNVSKNGISVNLFYCSINWIWISVNVRQTRVIENDRIAVSTKFSQFVPVLLSQSSCGAHSSSRLVQSFILDLRLDSSANHVLHRPFPSLPDWFYGLSYHLMFLFFFHSFIHSQTHGPTGSVEHAATASATARLHCAACSLITIEAHPCFDTSIITWTVTQFKLNNSTPAKTHGHNRIYTIGLYGQIVIQIVK